MIYFIYGEDQFRVRADVEALKEAAEKAGVPTIHLEADGLSFETLREHLTSGSLFSRKAAVFIKNLLLVGDIDLKGKVLELLDLIPAEVTVVIWEEGNPDRRSRHFLTLAKRARRLEKQPLTGGSLVQWTMSRARTKGVRLLPSAAAALAQLIGSDLARLDTELDKLALYAKNKPLGPDEILAWVPSTVPPGVFDLLDALGGQSRKEGLLMEQLLAAGEDPIYLLSMLAYQVRNLLLVSALLEEQKNLSAPRVARELRLHPFVAQKTLDKARLFTLPKLVELHQRLADLDVKIKTGRVDPDDALVLLVSRTPVH